ncbi:MAG: CtsR family transcriptional regulator [Christensenellaceae bacterium]|nr:CtsR family transcriptional regulator [Christensenellaceae bacterium]
MAILSDHIENFIKQMMEEQDAILELQRNELAQYFGCAPSQINYVLATRFSPERGYIVESRRGGGGYIKVQRIVVNEQDHLLSIIRDRLGSGRITAREAATLIGGLREMDVIDKKEEKILRSAISDRALSTPSASKDALRAGILKEMLLALLSEEE